MKEFCYVAKNMFRFSGRSRRREYWLSQLINYAIVYMGLGISIFIIIPVFNDLIAGTADTLLNTRVILFLIISLIVSILSLFLNLAVTIRRLHDVNKSGWFFIGCTIGALFCGIGNLILFVYLCMEGTEGINNYGDNPKDYPLYEKSKSAAPAIILVVISLIIFMIGYISLLSTCVNAAGGWDAVLNETTGTTESSFDDAFERVNDTENEQSNDWGTVTTEVTPAKIVDDVLSASPSDIVASLGGPTAWIGGTNLNSPARIGDWIITTAYSDVDNLHHTIYIRVLDVLNSEATETIISEYNKKEINVFEELDSNELEYRIIQYEMYIPQNFPADESGISSINIDFRIAEKDENGINYNGKTYFDLGSAQDITDCLKTASIMPGNLIQGQTVITMLKDFDNYLLEFRASDDENAVSEYIIGK